MNRVLNAYFPPEISKIIFSYSTLRQDIIVQRRRLRPAYFRLRPYNYYFFQNYYYLMGQIPPGEDHVWVETRNGGVLIYRM